MSKFNEKTTVTKSLTARPDSTVNHEGGLAFQMDLKAKLATQVLTSFVESKFYTDKKTSTKEVSETTQAVLQFDPEFVLKLAVYARKVMNLRSIPLFLLNEFALSGVYVPDSRRYVNACINRPDEIGELLALSMKSRLGHPEEKFRGKKSSMFILKGLAPAFNKFDEYQFSKYKGEGNEVSLKNALFMVHPAPKDEVQQGLFNKIADNALTPADTWENIISNKGPSRETWEAILSSGRMGYMAVLRNLHNFLRHGVNSELVVSKLTNPTAIQKSKQYPFRFYSAYKVLKESEYYEKAKLYLEALNRAMEISVANVPRIPGKSLILVDVSGSMTWQTISEHSKMTPADIAGIFGAISSKICEESDLVVFADEFGRVMFEENQGILTRMNMIASANVGGGTEAWRPMEYARKIKSAYDRIFLFSDMQCYTADRDFYRSFATEFIKYQREISPAFLYSVDLTGYGTAQVPQENNRVVILAGFSEKLFDFIPKFETNKETLIRDIEDYKV